MLVRMIPLAIMLVAGPFAQEQKPNFTGTWVLVAPAEAAARNPQVERIAQTADTLTRGHDSEGGGHKLTYKLDGTVTENRVAGMLVESQAAWVGSTLVLTDRSHTAGGAVRTTALVLSLDENGDLRIGTKEETIPEWTFRKKQ